ISLSAARELATVAEDVSVCGNSAITRFGVIRALISLIRMSSVDGGTGSLLFKWSLLATQKKTPGDWQLVERDLPEFRSNAFLPLPGALEIIKPGKGMRGVDHGGLDIRPRRRCHGFFATSTGGVPWVWKDSMVFRPQA